MLGEFLEIDLSQDYRPDVLELRRNGSRLAYRREAAAPGFALQYPWRFDSQSLICGIGDNNAR